MKEQEGNNKRVVPFVGAYDTPKRKRAINIMNQTNTSIHKVSLENNKSRTWVHKHRRVGRAYWTEETVRGIWDIVNRNNEEYRYRQLDEENEQMIEPH